MTAQAFKLIVYPLSALFGLAVYVMDAWLQRMTAGGAATILRETGPILLAIFVTIFVLAVLRYAARRTESVIGYIIEEQRRLRKEIDTVRALQDQQINQLIKRVLDLTEKKDDDD